MDKGIIDTDIISYFIKKDEQVAKKIIEYAQQFDKLTISLITYYEILKGLEYRDAKSQKERFIEFVQTQCEIVNISERSVSITAKCYGQLRKNGITIGTADLLIAGIALEKGLTLYTNNTKHFSAIENLKIENWKN